MEAKKNQRIGRVVEATQELISTAASGGVNKNQFSTQLIIPPHYFPPQQYPPWQYPGYSMYPMMPHPQMYGYQFPHHMHMMPPQYAMPTAFAKPPTSASSATSAKYAPNKVAQSKDGARYTPPADSTSDEMTSLSIKPTVSTETSSGDDTGSDANPIDTQSANGVDQNDLSPNSSHKNQDDRPSSSPPEMEEVLEEQQRRTEAHPCNDDSATSSNEAIPDLEEKSEVALHEIDSLSLRCADTKRNEQEGIESLLLLSRVAGDLRSAEDKSTKVPIHKQQCEQDKPSKKRKLQLPLRADRKGGHVPKRVPPPPHRTPAFFYFLLHHKESIEQAIFSDEDTCCGLERSEKVAEEGARWWLQSSEDEKRMWADVSSQKFLDLL